MYNVLIVDEEEHLLSALEQNLFPDREDIAIETASDGETGLEKLRGGPVDLLISDIKMPGRIDGFQLILRAKEVAPDARVIIMTAFGSNRVQNFADRIGITHYIEKPFNTSELRDAILEILDEREGFQGVLSDLELTDIIQMLCLARRTALLHLKHRDHRGRIIFQNGEVTHAEFDEMQGEDAVFRMLALRQGDIFMQSDFEPHDRTIDIGWQDLLFEGVRLADEQRADLDPDDDGLPHDDSYDEDGPNTDLGMGIKGADIDAMLVEEPSIDDEPALAENFFSDAELREIEQASEDAVEAELSDDKLPFATLEESSDDVILDARFGLPEAPIKTREEEDDFRTPFQREASAMLQNAAIMVEDPPADQFKQLLDEFARECPGLRQAGIVAMEDGLPLSFVRVAGGYDPDSIAALFVDIVASAQRTADSFGDDQFSELQIAVGDSYILARAVPGTDYLHVAVVDRNVSLGVAIVLMRRFQTQLRQVRSGK